MISEEMFKAWLLDPVTKEVIAALGRKREGLRQDWEGGAFTDYTIEGTVLVNVGNMGTCRGYAYVMELDYETLQGDSKDEE